MSLTSGLVDRLARWGRPSPGRTFLSRASQALGPALLAVPIAAVVVRILLLRPALAWLPGLVGCGLLAAVLIGALRAVFDRGDPFDAARRLDRLTTDRDEAFTLVDVHRRGLAAPFVLLLARRLAVALERTATAVPPTLPLHLPPLRRSIVAVVLAALILLVPGLDAGVLGPEVAPAAGGADGRLPGEAGGTGSGPGRGRDLGGRVEVTASTDRGLYVLGEEIILRVQIRALEPLPPDVPIGCAVAVDVETRLPLPTDLMLPRAAGDVVELEFRLKERLEAVGKYQRGLLALDTYVFPDRPEGELEGEAVGNRLIIQISENAERARTQIPQSVAQKKEQQQKRQKSDEKKPDKKPNEPKKRRDDQAGPGTEEKPPEDIESKPIAITPLFSGDQSSRRTVKVFDRDRMDSDRPPPEKPADEPKSRTYQPGREGVIEKATLQGREKSIVRRYLESIRPVSVGDPPK